MAINIMVQPKLEAIRKITKGAFWKRVTTEKRAELITAAKTDVLMEAQLLTIADSEYIDLDDTDLRTGFDSLVGTVFTDDDITRIFADGNELEIPEVLK